MQTHVKEGAATILAALALIATIHAGIWFTLFGTPDFSVLGYPFHYFWFVAGGPIVLFGLYWGYFQYITRNIQPEKDEMHGAHRSTTADGGDVNE
ncbi:MAG: hypothetical protein ACOCUO_01975 [archaeon]